MKSRSTFERKKPLTLTREGEPKGVEYQMIKRAAEILGVGPSNRYARLSQRWRRIVNATWRR